MAYEAAYQGVEQAKSPNQLDEAYEALRLAIEISSAINMTANDLLGPVPTAVNTNAKAGSVPNGVLGDLSSRAREAYNCLSEAHEANNRIRRAFGL